MGEIWQELGLQGAGTVISSIRVPSRTMDSKSGKFLVTFDFHFARTFTPFVMISKTCFLVRIVGNPELLGRE